jgi:hypothetical protein
LSINCDFIEIKQQQVPLARHDHQNVHKMVEQNWFSASIFIGL